LASSFFRTSSAVGSLQCFAYEVSYSMHILQTWSSALHALQTSSLRSGRLNEAREAPQRQQTSEFGIDALYIYAERRDLRADISSDARYHARGQLLEH
jgi:hypothetical protein